MANASLHVTHTGQMHSKSCLSFQSLDPGPNEQKPENSRGDRGIPYGFRSIKYEKRIRVVPLAG
jgi:hypothetical protein